MTKKEALATYYMHLVSGDIATLDDWRADYESMSKEAWHGKPDGREEDWLKDTMLCELSSDDEALLAYLKQEK